MTDAWEFSEDEGLLTRRGEQVRLTPKASAVLSLLLRRQGEIVSKAEILASVWGGLSVTPDLVREYVFDIRAALGDDALAPRYVETMRGRGYRLIGGVAFAASRTSSARGAPRIAVMRPEVFGGDAQVSQMADALGHDITRELSCYPDLAVVAYCPSSPIAPASTGGAAGAKAADLLVTISIAVGEERLAVAWTLIDVADFTIAAGRRIERARAELPLLTFDLAIEISSALGRFSGDVHSTLLRRVNRKPASACSAYEQYLLAVACESDLSLESWRQGLRHADRSIALDPTFARAWHMRGTFLKGLVNFFCDPELDRAASFREALDARRRSFSLDPHDPHILAWSADLDIAGGDLAAARDTLVRAVDLGATQPDTLAFCALSFATVLGAFHEAERLIDEAQRLSPAQPYWYRLVQCRVAYFAEDYAGAVTAAQVKRDTMPSKLFEALAFAMLGESCDANAASASLQQTFPNFDPVRYANDMITDETARERYMAGVSRLSLCSLLETSQATLRHNAQP